MENENITTNLIGKENDDIYHLDYENQKYENNNKFLNWKASKINKYGDKAKLYKCPYDNILFFYTSNEEENLVGKCPLCKKDICSFCSKNTAFRWNYNCCVRLTLKAMNYKGIEFYKANRDERNSFYYYEESIICSLIPCINFIFFVGIIFNFSFYKLSLKKDKEDNSTYEDFLKENNKFKIILIITSFIAIILSIPFLIINTFFSFIFLIMIPFNKSPFMYYIGFINKDFDYLYKNLHYLK